MANGSNLLGQKTSLNESEFPKNDILKGEENEEAVFYEYIGVK